MKQSKDLSISKGELDGKVQGSKLNPNLTPNLTPNLKTRVPGGDQGKIVLSDDFNALPSEFMTYM